MKKRKPLIVFLLVLLLLCSVFVSCSSGGDNNKNNNESTLNDASTPVLPTPTKLTAPTVVLSGDTATWSADVSADKFEISVDGNLSYIENSITSKKLSDGQTFKIRAIGDGTNYANSDWSNSVTYVKTIQKFTITWKNGDSVLETDTDVIEGTIPTYDGAAPVKASDAQYSYVFAGWSPQVVAANGNATYSATFTSVPNTYKVIWKNGDIVLETDENVAYGSTPTYNGNTPTKEKTAQYTYTFSGWTPEVSTVTDDITYQAQFTESINTFTVIFYDETGSIILDTVSVSYGETAVYSKGTPFKNATEGCTYTFDKWVTQQGGSTKDDLSNVVANRSVYASFKETVRTVTVCIVSGNTDYGSITISELNNIPYGTEIVVNGANLTIGTQTITAHPTSATAQYTYSFVDWSAPTTVGSDTIITANFTQTVNKYTVSWMNGTVVLETDENVEYGTTPTYNGATPTKPADDQHTYTFNGWSPSISSITGDITYYAQFTDATNKYTVTFYDEDGATVLGVSVVEYGQNASYPNATPTKSQTNSLCFEFEKWVVGVGSNEEAVLSNIVSNKDVYAKYTSFARKYTVKFNDYNGTTLKEELVAYGNSASAPQDPTRVNYRFLGWDKSFSNISTDTVVTAQYVRQYTVIFKDYNGTVLKTQTVDSGSNATPPAEPTRIGFTFNGWNGYYTDVTSNQTVTATYTAIENYIYSETQTVSNGQEILIPIKIANNTGLCGFEIVITYDVSVFTPTQVIASNNIPDGFVNDSIETSDENYFSIVWSGTSDFTSDGELFTIKMNVIGDTSQTVTISISYIPENTINAEVEEITLNCSAIEIIIQSEG